MSTRDGVKELLQKHQFEQYDLRCGCSCGWGTTLGGSYGDWAEHFAALLAKAEAPASQRPAWDGREQFQRGRLFGQGEGIEQAAMRVERVMEHSPKHDRELIAGEIRKLIEAPPSAGSEVAPPMLHYTIEQLNLMLDTREAAGVRKGVKAALEEAVTLSAPSTPRPSQRRWNMKREEAEQIADEIYTWYVSQQSVVSPAILREKIVEVLGQRAEKGARRNDLGNY